MKRVLINAIMLTMVLSVFAQENSIMTEAETIPLSDKSGNVPHLISFSGRLADNQGNPLNANLSITFSIYSVSSGGSALWSEVRSIQVVDGLFQVNLGVVNPLPASVFSGAVRWLGIKVGADAEMSPRSQIASVGYAMQAGGAAGGDLAGDYPNPIIKDGAITTSKLANNVSINTTGTIAATVTGLFSNAVSGTSSSSNGFGYGGNFISAGSAGRGVFGRASSLTGNTFGGYFISNSSTGTGVYGIATDNNFGDTYGVRGLVNSNNGIAVYGKNEGSGNYGMLGTFQAAVWGFHPSGNNTRIATSFDGLVASSTISNGYSIFAIQGSALRAAQIQGNMTVTGTLAKGGGSFEIDHPLDPSNRILRHSFVESPDMMNVYNGNVTTDDQGAATIVLPHYFEVLNSDFRYQLTVMGQFAQAIISREIENNSFEISTDKPNVKVSWQVTGIRQDRWAEVNRIVVEEDKSDQERGFYIHPEVFGLPENRQMEWGRRGEYMQFLEDEKKRMMELSGKDKE